MKVGIVTEGEAKAILDHTEGNFIGVTPGINAVLCCNPLTNVETNYPVANAGIKVANLLVNRDLRERFNELLGFEAVTPVSSLYSFFNGESFSDWIEVSYSTKLLSGNVGPNVAFSTGVGMKPKASVEEAVPTIRKLKDALKELDYIGEVYCGLAPDFVVTNVLFGHFPGHFAMYNEICKEPTQGVLDFIFGQHGQCELYDSVCVSNLVYQHPFPLNIPIGGRAISAPKGAEVHLWRQAVVNNEIVLITVYGSYIGEARKRIIRTLENLRHYDDNLMYRTDYGYGKQFVLAQEQYEKFLQNPWRKQQDEN